MKKIILIAFLLTTMNVAIASEIPVDAKLDYNQGIDFYKLGMYERSIQSFRSAIKAYPDYIDAYYNLGTVLEYLKQNEEALSVFKQIYIRNSNDYEVIYKLASLSFKIEDYTKAKDYIALIPTSSEYYKKAAEISAQIKKATTVSVPPANPENVASLQPGVYENIISPTGIVADRSGNVYVATFSSNTIIKINPMGNRQVFVKSSLIDGPISLAIDNVGNIYVSNYNANNVVKITPLGVVSVVVSKVDKPYGLHVSGNILFISCQGSNSVIKHKI